MFFNSIIFDTNKNREDFGLLYLLYYNYIYFYIELTIQKNSLCTRGFSLIFCNYRRLCNDFYFIYIYIIHKGKKVKDRSRIGVRAQEHSSQRTNHNYFNNWGINRLEIRCKKIFRFNLKIVRVILKLLTNIGVERVSLLGRRKSIYIFFKYQSYCLRSHFYFEWLYLESSFGGFGFSCQ